MRTTRDKLRKLPAGERKKLLETATIVFDTNALLQLYRYSEDARKSAFEIISSYKSRLFEPFQVCFEFYKLKDRIIREEKKEVTTLSDDINNFFNNKIGAARYGWIFEDVLKNAKKSILEKVKAIGATKVDFSKKDSVLDFCEKVFAGKISTPPSADKRLELCDVAKKRYEHKIAPGYKDSEKQYNPYGDYFIWYDIIEYAKKHNVDIIFVSNDVKSDWIEKGFLKDELVIEFNTETGRKIDYYSFETFLKNAAKNNDDVNISRPVAKELDSWKKTMNDLNSYQINLKKLLSLPDLNTELKLNPLLENIEKYNDMFRSIGNSMKIYDENLSKLSRTISPSWQELSEKLASLNALCNTHKTKE